MTDGRRCRSADDEIDWLEIAICLMGGSRRAAAELALNRTTIDRWRRGALANAKFGHVVALSKMARIPIEAIASGLKN